jgi:hypothetical protein
VVMKELGFTIAFDPVLPDCYSERDSHLFRPKRPLHSMAKFKTRSAFVDGGTEML